MQILPSFSFERKLWKKGLKVVAGVDEVGRGCFAGPVVAAAVAFAPISNEFSNEIIINDSKKMRPRQREKSADWIKKNALAWGIGEAPTSLINRIGMAKATKVAFRRAIAETNRRLRHNINFLLIDAFYIPYVDGLRRKNQKAIIDGDQKSYSVAAASIIAKVYRDKMMRSLSKQAKYKIYGWGRNKGYGTKEHQRTILKYGISRYHRREFVKTFLGNHSS